MLTPSDLQSILDQSLIPQDEIVYAFGYGSGVLPQQQQQQQDQGQEQDQNQSTLSSTSSPPLVDIILCVQDSYKFHQKNILINPHHYSAFIVSNQQKQNHPNFSTVNDSDASNAGYAAAADTAAKIATILQRGGINHNNNDYNSSPNHLTTLQWLFGLDDPGLYYNITDNIKYGIVQIEDLCIDLKEWKYLYIAGRLHKPVVLFIDRTTTNNSSSTSSTSTTGSSLLLSPSYLQETINIPAAFSAALLLQQFEKYRSHRKQQDVGNNNNDDDDKNINNDDDDDMFDLNSINVYKQIANLSYTGDPRITYGAEDPTKIQNLVTGTTEQLNHFIHLYQPIIQSLQKEGILTVRTEPNKSTNGNAANASTPGATSTTSTTPTTTTTTTTMFSWDWTNPLARDRLWQYIPYSIRQQVITQQRQLLSYSSVSVVPMSAKTPRNRIVSTGNSTTNNNNSKNTGLSLVSSSSSSFVKIQALQIVLASSVARASRYQAMKGIVTAGFVQSYKYLWRKLSKGKYNLKLFS